MALPAAIGIVVVCTGCGSARESPTVSPAAGGGEVFATAPPAPTPTPEEQKSADQIAADSLDATAAVPSVHISGSVTDDHGSATFELDKTTDAAKQVTSGPTTGTETIIVVGGKAYGAAGQGRFSVLDADLTAELQSLTLRGTVDCLRREHGTYSKGSISTVGGRRAIAIEDDGKAPGAQPSTLYVALDAPHLLLRVVGNGRVTPGGSRECGHPLDATVQSATDNFDYSRTVAPITAPT